MHGLGQRADQRDRSVGPPSGPGDLRDEGAPHDHRVGVLGERRRLLGGGDPEADRDRGLARGADRIEPSGEIGGSAARTPVTPVMLTK